MQPNGATVWARKTIFSEIFYKKPDKWFKIWFFIVNRVNHSIYLEWDRGECFIQSGEIETATRASPDQVKKCLKWLRQNDMVLTKRSTRGMRIKVIKYNVYQDLDNYKSTRKALEKHQRSTTINKNDKNDKESTPPSLEGLEDNMDPMSWPKPYNENEHGDEREVVIYPDGEPEKEAPPPQQSYRASDVIDLWNRYPDFASLAKIKKIKGRPRNPTTETQLLPPARSNKDLSYAIGIVMKQYTLEDFELAFDNYMRELLDRGPKDSWAGKRYSLYDLVKNKGYNLKTYVNR